MHNLCNCPNCQTNDCPAAAELEALTKRVELLKAGNLDNEEEIQGWANAKGKLEKEFDSLRTQNRELREIAQVLLYDSVVVPSEVQRFKDTLARIKEVEG